VSWQAGALAILCLALAAGFAWYERSRPDARIVALVGTLAAFAALGRIAFAAVPNVKPTTDIVLIAGYALGGGPGFAVGALAGLSSNFFFGQGPWTPWQMAAWGATGVIGALLARVPMRVGRWTLALVCCAVGFAFTAVQDVGDWVTYSDHSLGALGLYVGQGLGFDAIHAAGCLMFALALGPALTRSIARFARRLQVTWAAPGEPASPPVPGALAPVVIAATVALGLGLGPRPAAARAAGRSTGPAPAAAARAATGYLRGAQNADGGFGAAPGQASDQLFTGWAALGLAAAGDDLDALATRGRGVIAYLAAGVPAISDVGSLERTILVVRAAGRSALNFAGRDLVAELRRHIARDGAVSDQVNLTAFAVLALRAAGVAPPARTLAWLVAQQDRDGGFSFAGAGGSSDVDDTGAVLEALSADRGAAPAAARAIAYLRAQQDRDGGFPSQPGGGSNAQSTAWAVQGLDAAGVDPGALRRHGAASPLSYLSSLVGSDGQIAYARGVQQTPVWVTGEALMALEGRPLPLAPPAASPGTAGASEPAASASARPAAARRPASTRARATPRRVPPVTARPRPGARSPAGRAAPVHVRAAAAAAGAVPGAIGGLLRAVGIVTAVALAPVGLG
jgi:energy-coupling factor transport system substrate-specific component